MGRNCCGPAHFKGKDARGHLIDAVKKGRFASAEIHGIEPPGYIAAFADSVKETALYLTLLGMLLVQLALPKKVQMGILCMSAFALLVWKTGRSCLLAASREERLARTSEEEACEIAHHPESEKRELREIYIKKGFKGKLLDDVIDYLTSDKYIELQAMLEDELQIPLGQNEFHLQQASGAFVGVLLSALVITPLFGFFGLYGAFVGIAILMVIATRTTCAVEKNDSLRAIIWTLSLVLLTLGTTYFIAEWIGSFIHG